MSFNTDVRQSLLIESLRKKPYIHVPFPINHADLQKAILSFFQFLELPDSIKNHINLKISPMHRRGEIGFTHRDPDDNIYNDSKDFFHFHPLIFEKYGDFLGEQPAVREFMNQAKPIWQATYNTVYRIMQDFEVSYPEAVSKIFDTADVHIILRFLKYNWPLSGKYLAKPHFDAGSFTLAIAESCPGLRIGTNPNDLEAVQNEANKAIFMISSNFQKILGTDEFLPGWHDVVQLDKTKIGKPLARWAIVAFIEGHNVSALPRSETHKWYA